MRVATHSGSFHADELLALAVLARVHGELEIVRSRDADALAAAAARVDVGLRHDPASGDFDHHQRGGAGERANGIRYASLGLVWQAFGAAACGGDVGVAALVDESLVQGVDAADTGQTIAEPLVEGVMQMTVSHVLAGYNPTWEEPDDDAATRVRFDQALAVAAGILEREIASAASIARADREVAAAVTAAQDPRIVVLERGMPWHRAIHRHAPAALFVVVPKSSGWGVQAVPQALGQYANRLDLPAAWAGLQGAELATVTGVQDSVFCHAARFLAVARSQAGALRLAHKAITA